MKIKLNQKEINRLYNDIANEMKKVDAKIRAQYTGSDAQVIVSPARAAFKKIGLQLPDSDLTAYAESVANNEPFQFTLR
jgi:hypothetical protein